MLRYTGISKDVVWKLSLGTGMCWEKSGVELKMREREEKMK